jgi:hypothetical protein
MIAKYQKRFVVLRYATPAERRADFIMLVLGGAYCVLYWSAVGIQLWRLWPWH